MDILTDRQDHILGLLIRSFTDDGIPVGSKTLVDRFGLSVSSATVRNELSFLDEMGYLVQPHTSGGRIPTEKGYRYFVQRLLGEYELPQSEKQMIQHQFHQARLEIGQWMGLATAVLARTSAGASFITYPRSAFNRIKHIQLISTQGSMVLMILVLYGGEVSQQMLQLAESIPQARLTQAADRLNRMLEGLTTHDVRMKVQTIDWLLEREVGRLALESIGRSDHRLISRVQRAGITNLIDDDETRSAIHLLEETSRLAGMISTMFEEKTSGVQVVIGGDGRWEELKHCTIILSRYGVGNNLMGEVAVIGPTRMAYGRNISAVRYVASLMTEFVSDYYADSSLLSGNSVSN
ncbi:MAG: heat-inducible transcriptional repressor [Cellvibrionaceae bacterium]|jgi:heat-inducible transcriptional repressor